MSDSLRPHGLQHSRPPCPSPAPRVKLTSIKSVTPSNHLILCHPLLIHPQSFPASGSFQMSQLFTSGGQSIISPINEYSGLISFRMDWLDLLKSPRQHHGSKASILQHSAFFTVQLSHPYMITGKTKAWTRWTFVGKVMSLLFNMLSRLSITVSIKLESVNKLMATYKTNLGTSFT